MAGQVVPAATGIAVQFPCNDWIDKQHGLEKLLVATGADGHAIAGPQLIDYHIAVYTSDIRYVRH
jgi:hypothetical protein